MKNDIVHVTFDIPKDMHRQLEQLSIHRGCTLRSMLQDAVQNYIAAVPEQNVSPAASPAYKYTEDKLCETVFYLSRYAECLEIDKTITVPDERELLWMILDWARAFEENFDPGSGMDHHSELESAGTRWLLETFPYIPELDEQRDAVIAFIEHERDTSVVWPWALSAEEMIQDETLIRKIERTALFDQDYDADKLYEAIDRIAGANPLLKKGSLGMTEQSM